MKKKGHLIFQRMWEGGPPISSVKGYGSIHTLFCSSIKIKLWFLRYLQVMEFRISDVTLQIITDEWRAMSHSTVLCYLMMSETRPRIWTLAPTVLLDVPQSPSSDTLTDPMPDLPNPIPHSNRTPHAGNATGTEVASRRGVVFWACGALVCRLMHQQQGDD